jgi:hypothetical protein
LPPDFVNIEISQKVTYIDFLTIVSGTVKSEQWENHFAASGVQIPAKWQSDIHP